MSESSWMTDKISTIHLTKLAYIYIRQSTMGQVTKHRESSRLQYGLARQAERLGWPDGSIKIIDDDLGKSGRSSEQREGFQQLITEIGLGRVGLVLSYDATRLARNNKDWYQLLELCSLFDTLIGDSERVYDPSLYHDRLLLGLSGIMSEAELHQLRRRLLVGKRAKAERGELQHRLPVGLVRLPGGEVIQHPNEEVRNRIEFVFAKFQDLRSANAVARYMRKEHLPIPVRPLDDHDSTAHEWRPVTRQHILYTLHNPAYAGAYAHSRKKRSRTHSPGDDISPEHIQGQWRVLLKDRYPCYITWETFVANQQQLKRNLARHATPRPGVAGRGKGLLQGILICKHCGLRMQVKYTGGEGNPYYQCPRPTVEPNAAPCQRVWARTLDAEVEQLVLAALSPDQIEIAVAAHEALNREQEKLSRQWELRVERVHYEADRAQRQYDQVEPENRLVARSLERAWEEKLGQVARVEQEFQAWQEQQIRENVPIAKAELLKLTELLATVWGAATTTSQDKKEIIRLLLAHVVVECDYTPGKNRFQVNWQTGAISRHEYIRAVNEYDKSANIKVLQQRIQELTADGQTARQIADTLNAEGFKTAHRKSFTMEIVNNLRHKWKIRREERGQMLPIQWEDGSYSVRGASQLLEVGHTSIYKRIATGKLKASRAHARAPWHIYLTDEPIRGLVDSLYCSG